jgi:hypothetical protein
MGRLVQVIVEVVSRHHGPASIAAAFPRTVVIDVTSRGPRPWVQLSPFYPHGGIPVPFTPGVVATTMTGLKRAVRRHVVGHGGNSERP